MSRDARNSLSIYKQHLSPGQPNYPDCSLIKLHSKVHSLPCSSHYNTHTDVGEKQPHVLQAKLELDMKPLTFYCGPFCAIPKAKCTSVGTLLYSLVPFLAVHVNVIEKSNFTVLLTVQLQYVCGPKAKGLLNTFSSRSE